MKKITSYSFLILFFWMSYMTLHAQDTIVIRDADLESDLYLWTDDNVYLLDGEVVLEEGSLIILTGTTILAKDENSGLTIRPAARLTVFGLPEAPVVFTSPNTDFVYPSESAGQWRGITIQEDANSQGSLLFYTTIAYAGAPVDGQTGAALFLEGVGTETTLNHIDVTVSAGDGIRIHGGEAEIAYASVSFAQDDAFDWDFGWTGKGVYWFGYDMEGSGIEGKGNIGTNGRVSAPQVFNATFTGTCFFPDSPDGVLIDLKDNTAGLIANSIFSNFYTYGIQVEDKPSGPDARQQVENGNLRIINNVWWAFSRGDQLDASENGIIKIDPSAEDPQALFLAQHLQEGGNFYAGFGLTTNRVGDNGCYALDPRPHPQSMYDTLANAPYPSVPFFEENVDNETQKGAFKDESIWLEPWSLLDQIIFFGDDAQETLVYFKNGVIDDFIFTGDTIRVQCDSLADFHNNIGGITDIPCKPLIILVGSASRRGNKRRPKNESPEDEIGISFIEDWEYETGDVFGCHYVQPITFTLLIIDTIPPTIHPIPDGNGGLTAFSQDCDESEITNVETDTVVLDNGIRIIYTFTAEDYSGNTSTLTVEKEVNEDKILVYADLDGDGYGNPELSLLCSSVPEGFVTNNFDCNDDNPDINPDATSTSYPECPVSNDLCIYATEIPLNSDCVNFNMGGSTPTIYPKPRQDCGVTNVFSDIWAKFQAPAAGHVLLNFDLFNDDIGKGNSYVLEIYEGTCEELSLIDCIEGYFDFERIISNLIPEEYYYFRIFELTNNPFSEFTICLTEEIPSLSNNACEGAISIEEELSDSCISITFDNSLATYSGIFSCPPRPSRDLWFTYEVSTSDTLYISLRPEDIQAFSSPMLSVYYGPCDDLTPIDCIFTSDTSRALIKLFDFFPGTKLWIQAAEIEDFTGEYRLEICNNPPTAATSTNELTFDPNIQLFPNPTTGRLYLDVEVPTPTIGTGMLYDLNGKRVKTFFERQPLRGRFASPLEIGDLENGIYLFALQTPEGRFVRKIVIMK